MASLRLIIVAVCVFLLSFSSQKAFAVGSGAFRDESVDAATVSMGNAFVGEANTTAAVYFNPAGLNQIDSTTMTLSDAVIAPRASFTDLSGNTTQMRNNEFNVPNFNAVVPIIKNKFTVGAGVGSYWGLGTDWAPNSFSQYVATKDDLVNTDSTITGAYQVTDQWSIAAAADNDYSRADENKKFADAFDGTNGNIELKAHDDSWGYRLATLFKINDQNQVGLMYRSPVSHDYIGKVYIDGIGPTLAGFVGASSFETRATEKLTLPQSVVAGYSVKPTSKLTLNLDIEWMDWSSIKQETIDFPDVVAGSGLSNLLTGPSSIPHDWTSTISEAIGAQYAATDRFRVRAGFYHHPYVGPQDGFDTAIPDLDEFGYTLGFGYDLTSRLTLDVGCALQTYLPRKVDSSLGSTMINGTYHEILSDGVVSLTYKF